MSLIAHPLENGSGFPAGYDEESKIKQLQPPYRLFPCGFSLLVALGSLLLISNYLQAEQTQAQSLEPQPNTSNNIPLRWLEFPVVTSTVRAINVHKNTILWSAYLPIQHTDCDDYTPYPPPEASLENDSSKSLTIPEEIWEICLYNSLDGSLKMLGSGGDLDYPDMYGDWVVMDRNIYIGTLRAENIATGEERDIWYKAYEERTLPRIHQETVVSSPDNKSLMAYNLGTGTFTDIVHIPDYPDNRILNGDVYENIVVWKHATNADYDFDIMGFDLTTQQIFTVTDLPGHEILYGIENNYVYWGRDGTIYWKNLLTGEEFNVEPMGNQGSVRVSGDWLVWTDDRHGAPTLWDIYAYNMTTQQEYRLTSTSQPIFGLGFGGTLVAWSIGGDGSPYGTQIKAFQLLPYSAFLPLLQR